MDPDFPALPVVPGLMKFWAAKRQKEEAMSKKRLPGTRAYAWECDFGLCAWAEPSREQLDEHPCGKPSPEATPVLVRLVKESELRRLVQAAKGGE